MGLDSLHLGLLRRYCAEDYYSTRRFGRSLLRTADDYALHVKFGLTVSAAASSYCCEQTWTIVYARFIY